jgi:CheY-like chemotaxis protein
VSSELTKARYVRAASAIDLSPWAFLVQEVASGARVRGGTAGAPRPQFVDAATGEISLAHADRADRVADEAAEPLSGAARRPARREAVPRRLRVIIADDDRLFVETLKAILAHADGLEIVGCAQNGAEAVSLVATVRPDLALLDLNMPILDGLDAARQILRAGGTRVILVTGSDDTEVVAHAREVGVSVLGKDLPLEDLVGRIVRLAGPPEASAQA